MTDQVQEIVCAWGRTAFGEDHMNSQVERAMRLLEEAIELYQAVDAPAQKAHELVDLVFSRPKGRPFQELGGVGVTWMAMAGALGYSADHALHLEIVRVLSKPTDHFTKRNEEKKALGFSEKREN